MNCETILERLDDYIDGELDARENDLILEHLERCTTCNREHRATVRLLEQAAVLSRDEVPSRDLWGGIHTRLQTPPVGRRSGARPWVLTAAAAVLFLAVMVGPGLQEPADMTESAQVVTPVSYQEADERFLEVREQLLAGLTSGEDRLDPETVRMVRKNLKVMDDSAAEIRKALAADPGNSGLRRMLMASYRYQTKLLTRVRDYPEAM